MESLLRFFKKYIIPKGLFRVLQPAYHLTLAFLGALIYGFPSRKLIAIGVTGTKGKTTTSNLIAQILTEAGAKTGLATTVNFKIGEREWINETKQTMLGRFELQRLLKQMVKEGVKYAVIETSSEGVLQSRHRFIDYRIAVFTNLTPEHIERHGGFENYRAAKIELFKKAAQKENSIGIYNIDDKNISYFLEAPIKTKYGITKAQGKKNPESHPRPGIDHEFQIKNIKLSLSKTEFDFNNEHFEMPLVGEFNVYNAALAICVGLSQNISLSKIKNVLRRVKPVPGRMELVNKGQNFTVVADYAHEPASLEAVYKTISNLLPGGDLSKGGKSQKSKIICLLGGQGGGRDKWKRAVMGKLAGRYCDIIILTNEDPYDEKPISILNDIEKGVLDAKNYESKVKELFKIVDRKEAIRKALSLAKSGDVVALTGKGGEVWMCMENDKKIPWDEKKIAEQILNNSA